MDIAEIFKMIPKYCHFYTEMVLLLTSWQGNETKLRYEFPEVLLYSLPHSQRLKQSRKRIPPNKERSQANALPCSSPASGLKHESARCCYGDSIAKASFSDSGITDLDETLHLKLVPEPITRLLLLRTYEEHEDCRSCVVSNKPRWLR